MVTAQQPAVRDVGVAALGPGDVVVGVAQAGWLVAVDGRAAAVSEARGDALVLTVKATLAADVEGLAPAAEDGRGLDGEPAGCGGCGLLVSGAGALCLGEEAETERDELGLGLGEVLEGVALLVGSHRPGGGVGLVGVCGQASGDLADRVWPVDQLAARE